MNFAIDLGTTKTIICSARGGLLLEEPSVIAWRRAAGARDSLFAVGTAAHALIGRVSADYHIIRPMQDGVIADFEATQAMLGEFIRRAIRARLPLRRTILISAPVGATVVESRAIAEAAERVIKCTAIVFPEPLAAAIGAGLPVWEPRGQMVIDIGGGSADIALISLGGIVRHKSLCYAGARLYEEIGTFIRRKYALILCETMVEKLKRECGNALPPGPEEPQELAVIGQDQVSGVPREVVLPASDVREAVSGFLVELAEATRDVLAESPPELVADVLQNGVVLAGGGACLRNLDRFLAGQLNVSVRVAADPTRCVARGGVAMLGHVRGSELRIAAPLSASA
jgi:rod shape-determining protein MreB